MPIHLAGEEDVEVEGDVEAAEAVLDVEDEDMTQVVAEAVAMVMRSFLMESMYLTLAITSRMTR